MKKIAILSLFLILAHSEDSIPQEENRSQEDSMKTSHEIQKNGFLMGVEMNFGENRFGQRFLFFSQQNPNANLYRAKDEVSSSFGFDAGIKIGYQHYFEQEYGLKVSFYGGLGNPIDARLKRYPMAYATSFLPFKESNRIKEIFSEIILNTSYLPIRFGVNIDFLYDFFSVGKHTLGLTLGIGYRLSYYFNQSRSFEAWSERGSHLVQRIYLPKEDFIENDFYPQMGFRYEWENHQIEFLFRLSGLIDLGGSKGTALNLVGESGEIYRYDQMKFENIDSISLNYTYRF